MDIPKAGSPIAHTPYPIPLKIPKVHVQRNKTIGKCSMHIKKFKPMGSSSCYGTKKPDPLNPQNNNFA